MKEAVRREASVEIVMEESPEGDHQAHGVAENAVETAHGQLRLLKESRMKFLTAKHSCSNEESELMFRLSKHGKVTHSVI